MLCRCRGPALRRTRCATLEGSLGLRTWMSAPDILTGHASQDTVLALWGLALDPAVSKVGLPVTGGSGQAAEGPREMAPGSQPLLSTR